MEDLDLKLIEINMGHLIHKDNYADPMEIIQAVIMEVAKQGFLKAGGK